jgi:2'-5' RNA ligase
MGMWICFAYRLSEASADQLEAWAKEVGVELIPRHKLHLTIAYSHEGHDDFRVRSLAGPAAFQATPTRLSWFEAPTSPTEPLVLEVEGDFYEHAQRVQQRLLEWGYEIPYLDPYKPHITVSRPSERYDLSGLALPSGPPIDLVETIEYNSYWRKARRGR